MGFKRTTEGRVFFQGSNGTANDRGARGEMAGGNSRVVVGSDPVSPGSIGQAQQTQIQIVTLLKTLNERLKATQAERNNMRKELEAYRAMVGELEEKAERSERAYMELEHKITRKPETNQAQMLVQETIKELEETRRLLLELEEKTDRADQGVSSLKAEVKHSKKLGDHVLKRQEELEKLQKQQAQKLTGSTLHYTELTKRMREAEEQQESLSGRIDETVSQQARLIRKVDKAIEERARFMRKIERIEETVIQTRDSLNAKAMVLLTDQGVAAQMGVDDDFSVHLPISENPESDSAIAQDKTDVNVRSSWRRFFQALSVIVVAGALILGGWMMSQMQGADFSEWRFSEKLQIPDMTTRSQELQQPSSDVLKPAPETVGQLTPLEDMDWSIQSDTSAFAPDSKPTQEITANKAPIVDDIGALDLNDQEQIAGLLDGNIDAVAPQLAALEPGDTEDETDFALTSSEASTLPEKAVTSTPAQEARAIKLPALKFTPVPAGNAHDVIKPDPKLKGAIKEIEDHAFNGVPEAQHDLAAIYTAGHGDVKQDYTRAAAWFRQAAAQGVANANYNLGVLYHQGLGVEQDMGQAISWYENAAALGHPEAQYNLGIAYIEGIGVKYDPYLAAAFFTSAASQGITEAAYNIGLIYENGLLGKPEPDKAIMWYKTAADKGNPEARQALKQLAETLKISLEDVNALADKVRAESHVSPALPKAKNVPEIKVVGQKPQPVTAQEDLDMVGQEGDLLQADSTQYSALGTKQAITAQIQEHLMKAGLYPGPADGFTGALTEDAVRTYQAQNNLKTDGKLSKELLMYMLANDGKGSKN